MAGELAHDPTTGQLVYSPATGQLALDCAGAAVACTDCDGAQPDVTITVVGAACADAQGDYEFDSFVNENRHCYWIWFKDDIEHGWVLGISYWPGSGTFCSALVKGGIPLIAFKLADDCPEQGGHHDVTAEVSCDKPSGLLNGTFDLGGFFDCNGSTATIELNP